MTTSRLYDLKQRTLQFSVLMIKHISKIKQPVMRPIVDQLIRSATSIGANYAEANNASSKIDFRNKIFIAKKECAETEYWLDILYELGDKSDELALIRQEAHELLMILQKIISSLRSS